MQRAPIVAATVKKSARHARGGNRPLKRLINEHGEFDDTPVERSALLRLTDEFLRTSIGSSAAAERLAMLCDFIRN